MGHVDPAVITQLLIALATLATALAGYFKSRSNSSKLDVNTAITKATQTSTDGIVTKLVGVASDAAYAAGQKDQVDKQADIKTAVDAARKAP
jgi:hypothetical protein